MDPFKADTKIMQELVIAVRRHECEVLWVGIEIGDDGWPIALFQFEPCSRTCSIAYLFGHDVIYQPVQLS